MHGNAARASEREKLVMDIDELELLGEGLDDDGVLVLTEDDEVALSIAGDVAKKLLRHPKVTPQNVTALGLALHALDWFPRMKDSFSVEFGVTHRRGTDMDYINFEISDEVFCISRGGSRDSGIGSDSFSERGWHIEKHGYQARECELGEITMEVDDLLSVGGEICAYCEGADIDEIDWDGDQVEETEAEGVQTEDKPEQRVLWVDDEPDLLEMARALLESDGHLIDTAESADEALRLMAERSYSVVFADIPMPRMSGRELFKIVKERYPQTPFVYATSYWNDEVWDDVVNGGVRDFIYKPFTVGSVLATVRDALLYGPKWRGSYWYTIANTAITFILWVVCDNDTGMPGTLLGRAYRIRGTWKERRDALEELMAADHAAALEYEPPEGLFDLVAGAPFSACVKSWAAGEDDSGEYRRLKLVKQVCESVACDLRNAPPNATEKLEYRIVLCYRDQKGNVRPVLEEEDRAWVEELRARA